LSSAILGSSGSGAGAGLASVAASEAPSVVLSELFPSPAGGVPVVAVSVVAVSGVAGGGGLTV
jgi:hypothetical protein